MKNPISKRHLMIFSDKVLSLKFPGGILFKKGQFDRIYKKRLMPVQSAALDCELSV